MKINTFLIILLLLTSAYTVYAQDVIVKNDKTELNVKVEEITAMTVKFRYFSRLDGPIYNINKADIFLIVYKDGYRESFTTPTAAPVAVSGNQPSTANSEFAPKEISEQFPRKTQNTSQQPAASSATAKRLKDHGWAYGLGYMTPTSGFAQTHGYTLSYGYYKQLGQKRTAALLIDLAGLGFFTKNSPVFYSLTGNGLLRLGSGSKAYIGSGLGYVITFIPVPTYDRYGNVTSRSTATYGDICGSVFLGVGMLRAGIVLPSLGASSGGLFTVGLFTNPFK